MRFFLLEYFRKNLLKHRVNLIFDLYLNFNFYFRMKKSTFFLTIIGIFVLIMGFLVFITIENDHKECSQKIEFSVGENGEKIKKERHICKENFSF